MHQKRYLKTTRHSRDAALSGTEPQMAEADQNAYVLEDQIGYLLPLANQRHLEIFAAALSDVTPPSSPLW